MDVRLRGPSLHDASYYSLMETSFRILPQCIQIAQGYQVCCCLHETSPHLSSEHLLASRMYIDTVSTSSAPCVDVLGSASCKSSVAARNHKSQFLMNPVNMIFQMCRHLERFDAVVVRTDPRSDVRVHFHSVCNLTTLDVLNLQSGNLQ
jgi:hypothetical protein